MRRHGRKKAGIRKKNRAAAVFLLPSLGGAAHRRREKGEAFEKLLSDSHGGSGGVHSTFMEVFISQPGVFECLLQYGPPAVTGLDEQQRSVLGAGCQLSVEEYGV